MRCNKPVILTGGKFFRLSVQTYISVKIIYFAFGKYQYKLSKYLSKSKRIENTI